MFVFSIQVLSQPTDTVLFNFRRISDERTPLELKNGFTTCVQDKIGFIWFGSHDGLFRYDGVNYKAYKNIPSDTNTIGGQWIQGLKLDLNGNIWIGGDGWLSRLNPVSEKIKTWRFTWNEQDGNGSTWNFSFVCDNHDADIVWFPINSSHTVLGRFDISKNKFSFIPMQPENKLVQNYPVRYLTLTQDSNGVLYEGRIGSVIAYNPKTDQHWVYLSPDKGRHFGLDVSHVDKTICINWDSSFTIYPGKVVIKMTQNPFNFHTYGSIGYVVPYSDKKYLIMEAGRGAMIYDEYSGRFSIVSSKDLSIRQNLASPAGVIVKDNSGRCWISARGIFVLDEHLNRIKPLEKLSASFKNFSSFEKWVIAIVWNRADKHLYVFNKKTNSLLRCEPFTGELKRINIPFSKFDASVSEFTLNPSNSQLIFMYDMHLCNWDYRTKTIQATVLEPDSGYLKRSYLQSTSVLIDAMHHSYWISDFWDGVISYDYINKHTTCYSYKKTFPLTDNIRAGAVVGDDVYFISHQGFCRYHYSTSKFDKLAVPDINAGAGGQFRFNDLAKDTDESFWMTSPHGLFHYNTQSKKWKHYTTAEGMLMNDVSKLKLLGDGKILLTYDWGLFIYDLRTNTSKRILNDIVDTEYNIEIGDDGNVFFENRAKFFYGNFNEWNQPDPEFPLVITSIEEHNREIKLPLIPDAVNEINLNHNQDYIILHFASLNYTFSNRIDYEYQFEGLNDNWINTKGNTQAAFGNLEPGNYIFHLRAKSIDGVWHERKNPLHIIIHPAWWQTWWFKVLAVLALAGSVYLFYRNRIRQILKLQTIRNSIARDLHDDVGSTLSSIRIMSTIAQNSPAQSAEVMKTISKNSQRMLESMSDIVWAVDPENDSLNNIIVRMNQFAAQTLEPKNISFTVKTSGNISQIKLPMEKRRDFYLIFKEAVNNLAKYSEATKAEIEINTNGKSLAMKICDNGKGIDNPQLHGAQTGNGLKNMKRRAAILKGTLEIISGNGTGTIINLEIPIT